MGSNTLAPILTPHGRLTLDPMVEGPALDPSLARRLQDARTLWDRNPHRNRRASRLTARDHRPFYRFADPQHRSVAILGFT